MNIDINKIHLGCAYSMIKNIKDKSIDCIYTDVPYKHLSGGAGQFKRINELSIELNLYDLNDGFDYKILDDFVRVLKKINIFIWCSRLQIFNILSYFENLPNVGFEILTWHKINPIPSTNNKWLPDTEYCLYFREKGVRLNDGYDLKSKFHTSGVNLQDKHDYKHPTIKPLELVKRHLKHATQPNDLILDMFSGSGTTALAAIETNRNFICFENKKKWVDISNNRIKNIMESDQEKGIISIYNLLNEVAI